MTTAELIKALQEADPDGKEHCCVDNAAIVGVSSEPAYHDGPMQIIELDEAGRPIRGHRHSRGVKISIDTAYINECLELPGFAVLYLTDEDRARYEHLDNEERRLHREIDRTVDRDAFADWVFRKIQTIRPVGAGWFKRIIKAAIKFYDEHSMGPDSPMVEMMSGKSYSDCKQELWEQNILVDWDNFSRIIIEMRETS